MSSEMIVRPSHMLRLDILLYLLKIMEVSHRGFIPLPLRQTRGQVEVEGLVEAKAQEQSGWLQVGPWVVAPAKAATRYFH